nr:hypothetical protein BDOA9_0153620 [Bradyrhizobium sp. DOA9]
MIIGRAFSGAGALYTRDELFEIAWRQTYAPCSSRPDPMRSTTSKEKAKIVAGAATALVMTAMLFVFALGLVLSH